MKMELELGEGLEGEEGFMGSWRLGFGGERWKVIKANRKTIVRTLR